MRVSAALRSEDSRKPAEYSREAAQDYSPPRKPWVAAADERAPKGRKNGRDLTQALLVLLTIFPFLHMLAQAAEPVQIKIRDLASVEGVRENPLIGYGMIVGLNGTGDKQQTVFAVQTLAGILQRMGVQIPAGAVRVKNVASVFVTANLAPFARPGTQLDITVSSIGDAKSLEGGLLLL